MFTGFNCLSISFQNILCPHLRTKIWWRKGETKILCVLYERETSWGECDLSGGKYEASENCGISVVTCTTYQT
jgi:hypothetical protein